MRGKRYAVIAATVVVLVACGYFAIERLAARALETDKLREFIAARTGRVLGGETALNPLTAAHGFWVDSLGMAVRASPPRALSELRAFKLSSSFSLLELWRGKWRLDHVNVGHFQAAYGAEAARLVDGSEFATPEFVAPAQNESVMAVDVRKVSFARADLFWGEPAKSGGEIRNTTVECYPDGKNLYVEGRGGSYRQAKWPETRILGYKLYYAQPTLRIDEGHLALGESGTIDVHGQFQFEQKAKVDLQLKLAHCPIAPFVAKSHQKDVEGTFTADAHVQKLVGDSEALTTNGSAALESAVVKNVQALVKAASFTGDKRLKLLTCD